MIEMNVLNQRYYCRTKEYLWHREMSQAIRLVTEEHKKISEIKNLGVDENIFNSASTARAKDMTSAIVRRLEAVDDSFLSYFNSADSETQLQLCVVMIMLTDRSFLEFMDSVYREKLITREDTLRDSDLIGFFHQIQDKDERAAKWTDAGIKKAAANYKTILKDAGMLSEGLGDRKVIRPIIRKETEDFLESEGLKRLYKILAGER